MSEYQEIIFHLKVIELFLGCIAGLLAAFLGMIAIKYKGIL